MLQCGSDPVVDAVLYERRTPGKSEVVYETAVMDEGLSSRSFCQPRLSSFIKLIVLPDQDSGF